MTASTDAPADDVVLDTLELLVDLVGALDQRVEGVEAAAAVAPAWAHELRDAMSSLQQSLDGRLDALDRDLRAADRRAGAALTALEQLRAAVDALADRPSELAGVGDDLRALAAVAARADERAAVLGTAFAALDAGVAALPAPDEVADAVAARVVPELAAAGRGVSAVVDRVAADVAEHVEALAEVLDLEGAAHRRRLDELAAALTDIDTHLSALGAPSGDAGGPEAAAPGDGSDIVWSLHELDRLRREMASLRADVHRALGDSVGRVLDAVSAAERSTHGGLRSLADRLGDVGDDARAVRALRDALAALADDIDDIRRRSAGAASSADVAALARQVDAARDATRERASGAAPATEAAVVPLRAAVGGHHPPRGTADGTDDDGGQRAEHALRRAAATVRSLRRRSRRS